MPKLADRIRAFLRPTEAKAFSADGWVGASVPYGDTTPFGRRPSQISGKQLRQYFAGWPYVAASINARGVSAIPLRVYRESSVDMFRTRAVRTKALDQLRSSKAGITRKMMDSTDDMEEVTDRDHPLVALLNQPNPYMSGTELLESLMLSLQLCGTAFAHIVQQEDSPPNGLYFMPTPWTKIAATREAYIDHYLYGVDGSVEIRMEPNEVVRIVLPNPTGDEPLWGIGPMQASDLWNQVSHNISVFQANTFQNSGFPSMLAVVKNAVGTQLEEFRSRITQLLTGVRKAGDIAVINGDVELTKWNLSQEELGFLQASKDKRDDIAAAFGVPTSLLTVENVNLANSMTAAPHWQLLTIRPYTQRIEDALNRQLLPRFRLALEDPSLCVAFDNPVEEESNARATRAVQLFQGGILTQNEARMEIDWEPVPGGDEFYSPPGFQASTGPNGFPAITLNMDRRRIVVDEPQRVLNLEQDNDDDAGDPADAAFDGERDEPVRNRKAGARPGKNSRRPEEVEVKSERLAIYLGAGRDQGHHCGLSLARVTPGGDVIWKGPEELSRITQLEAETQRIMQARMRQWFDRMIPRIVESVLEDGTIGLDLSVDSDAGVVLRELMQEPASQSFMRGVLIGLEELPDLEPGLIETATDRARAFTQANLVRLSESTLATVKEGVELRLREALDSTAGSDFREVQRAVAEALDRDSDFVSRRIARTESVRMSQDGRLTSWDESGVVTARRWLTRGDNKVAEPCLTIDRDFNIALKGQPFAPPSAVIAGFAMNYDPRGLMTPPAKPNCRCTMVPII